MRALFLSVLALGILLSLTSAANLRFKDEWTEWKEKYDKEYPTPEVEEEHRKIWERNLFLVEEHNNRADVSFKLEMNRFADIERDTKQASSTSKFHVSNSVKTGHIPRAAPPSWDWRKKGAISAVKNQGQMGSVAAIATVEELESYYFINKGKMESISVAEVVDCCTHGGSTGGMYYNAFKCVHNIGGICSEEDYPHITGSCKNSSCSPVVTVDGGAQVPTGNEAAMMEIVYKMPVMAGIDAGHASFQLYRSGIYNEPGCSSSRLDHAVQVVGYGTQDGQDFWICKNSWGLNWGMNGFILMARNKKNMCGIATAAYYPV